MTTAADLDRIERILFEDPSKAVDAAEQAVRDAPPALRLRALNVLGNSYRGAGSLDSAEATLEEAAHCSGEPFDVAQCWYCRALLRSTQQRWSEALEMVDAAAQIHVAGGDAGLPGPADRGLPTLLVVRGTILHTAHWHGDDVGDLFAAGTDYRRALELAPDPRVSRVFLSAVHNLGVLATETGSGLTLTQDALWKTRRALRELGIPRTSVPAAKVEWVSAVVDAELFTFRPAQERQLERARRNLHPGAVLRALALWRQGDS